MSDKRGSIIMISFDDLVMEFARFNDLANYSILIASREISGSLKTRDMISGIDTGIHYESKYDNIEFVDTLVPPAKAMEYLYDARQRDAFVTMYNSHLLGAEPLSDLCAVVDMAVNEGCDILIVFAAYECSGRIPEYLQIFIEDQFGFKSFVYSDVRKLVTLYEDDRKMFDKFVRTLEIEVPDEFDGHNFECVIRNYGDINEIQDKLRAQEEVAAMINKSPGENEDIKSVFYNRFTESLEDKVIELLLNRSDDDIKDMCRARNIRIVPGSSKEMLVDKILHDMRLSSQRRVEYETP